MIPDFWYNKEKKAFAALTSLMMYIFLDRFAKYLGVFFIQILINMSVLLLY